MTRTPAGRPTGRSAATAARQRLAEQERARREATEGAIEGVWLAADAQDAAREALSAADAAFRMHVDVLRAQGKSLDDIAELTGMPLAELRAARRGGAPSSAGEDGTDEAVSAVVPDPSAAKPAGRKPAGGAAAGAGVVPGDGGGKPSGDPAAGGAGGQGKPVDAAPAGAAGGEGSAGG